MLLGLSLFSEDGEGYAAEPGGEGLVQVGGTSTMRPHILGAYVL